MKRLPGWVLLLLVAVLAGVLLGQWVDGSLALLAGALAIGGCKSGGLRGEHGVAAVLVVTPAEAGVQCPGFHLGRAFP
jgi:hypothetical protein